MSSTTLLPFLYQTRTLAGVGRAASIRRLAQKIGESSSLTLSASFPTPSSQRHVSTKQNGKNQKYRGVGNPGEDIPFEYALHTPGPPKPTKQDLATTTLTPTERQAFEAIFADIEKKGSRPVVPFSKEEDTDEISFEGEAIPDEHGGGEITHSLRAILDHAGEQFNSRNSATFESLSPLRQLQTPVTDRGKLVMKYPSALRKTAHKALHFLDQQAVGTPAGPALGTVTSEVERTSAFQRAIKLEKVRREERSKVEAIMKDATTDVELWNVMETHVFSMITKMRLADHQIDKLTDAMKGEYASPSALAPKSPRKRRKKETVDDKKKANKAESSKKKKLAEAKKKADEVKEKLLEMAKSEGENEGSSHEASPMSIRIHGPLYPGYIQLGLRLLDSNFSRSSPLALSLLPRVKELGLASYVLGVSTPLYNSLMEICWGRYGDVGAVLKILEEVRITGLFMDEQTLNLLHHIRLRLRIYSDKSARPSAIQAAGFHVGAFARRLAHMPEYDSFIRERVGYWLKEVHRNMEERQQTLGY